MTLKRSRGAQGSAAAAVAVGSSAEGEAATALSSSSSFTAQAATAAAAAEERCCGRDAADDAAAVSTEKDQTAAAARATTAAASSHSRRRAKRKSQVSKRQVIQSARVQQQQEKTQQQQQQQAKEKQQQEEELHQQDKQQGEKEEQQREKEEQQGEQEKKEKETQSPAALFQQQQPTVSREWQVYEREMQQQDERERASHVELLHYEEDVEKKKKKEERQASLQPGTLHWDPQASSLSQLSKRLQQQQETQNPAQQQEEQQQQQEEQQQQQEEQQQQQEEQQQQQEGQQQHAHWQQQQQLQKLSLQHRVLPEHRETTPHLLHEQQQQQSCGDDTMAEEQPLLLQQQQHLPQQYLPPQQHEQQQQQYHLLGQQQQQEQQPCLVVQQQQQVSQQQSASCEDPREWRSRAAGRLDYGLQRQEQQRLGIAAAAEAAAAEVAAAEAAAAEAEAVDAGAAGAAFYQGEQHMCEDILEEARMTEAASSFVVFPAAAAAVETSFQHRHATPAVAAAAAKKQQQHLLKGRRRQRLLSLWLPMGCLDRRGEAPLHPNIYLMMYFRVLNAVAYAARAAAIFDAYLFLRFGGNRAIGTLTVFSGLITIIVAPLAGIICDMFKTQRSNFLRVAAVFTLLCTYVNWRAVQRDSFHLLILSTFMWKGWYEFVAVCSESLFNDCIPPGRRSELYVVRRIATTLANGVGPLLSLFVFAVEGNTWSLPVLHSVLCVGNVLSLPQVLLLWWWEDVDLPHGFHASRFDEQQQGEEEERARNSSSTCIPNEQQQQQHALLQQECALLLQQEDLEQQQQQQDSDNTQEGLQQRKQRKEKEEKDKQEKDEEGKMKRRCAPRAVPWLIFISHCITFCGAGMTVKYFPLYFKTEYDFKPIHTCLLSSTYTLFIVAFTYAIQRVAIRWGRAQASLVFTALGVSCLFLLVCLRKLPLVILVYLLRGALQNASTPLDRSLVMDCIDPQHVGKWSALQSLATMMWSLSALFGGLIADRVSYRSTFVITGCVYIVSEIVYLPILWLLPPNFDKQMRESHRR